MSDPLVDGLGRVAPRLAMAHLELVAKGYSEAQCTVGLRWAVRSARASAARIGVEDQPAAFAAAGEAHLREVERYLAGCAKAAADQEHRRQLERAAREGEYGRQLGRSLAITPQAAARHWAGSTPDQAVAYETLFGRN